MNPNEITPRWSAEGQRMDFSHRSLGSRLRFVIAVVSTSAIVILVVGIARYQPISTSAIGVSANQVSTPNGSQVPREPGDVKKSWIMPSGKAVLEVVATISNRGPLGVEIVGIGAPVPTRLALLGRIWRIRVRVGMSSSWMRDRVFKPFVLGSHRSTMVVVRETLSCVPRPGNTWEVSTVPVSTRFLSLSHDVAVPIEPFSLVLPSSC